jgi:hypothetical protein
MTAEVLALELIGPVAVLAESVRRAVQERLVARPVQVFQLADQVGLG